MKIYTIRKFKTPICGLDCFEPWKITNNYNLILREIKNDLIDDREVLQINYEDDPKYLITVNKIIPNHRSYAYCGDGTCIETTPCNWPLYTYIVSEIEVITE